MAIPLGVFAYQAAASPDEEGSRKLRLQRRKLRTESLLDLTAFLAESARGPDPTASTSPLKKAFLKSLKLTKDRRASTASSSFTKSLFPRSSSPRSNSAPQSTHNSLAFGIPLARIKPGPAPRHVPIVHASARSDIPSTPSDPGYTSASTVRSSSSSSSSSGDSIPFVSCLRHPGTPYSAPRNDEVKTTSWSCPVLEHPISTNSPPLSQACFDIIDAGRASTTQTILSSGIFDTGTIEMDHTAGISSPDHLGATKQSNGSPANLGNTYGSQASLVGMRAEYESASEAESTNQDPPRHATRDGAQHHMSPASGTSGLSGLVCNVHRTTGKEPHPLVGATTTVLGDKLFVFGGRRLSRTRPQLTSNLFELDLIRRHWTKLDTSGDVPPPRYFHSVCALGDTKLVCYGGMSPSPNLDGADVQSEVVVMSDIHIYDVPTRVWTKISTPDAPQGRYAHCAAILPSSAVFASPHAPMSALQHNPSSNNPNQGSLGVAVDGTGGAEMVVVGGQDSANHYIEQVSVFNLRSLKWTGTTGMGRSCGAYRSVVTPLTTMTAVEIGAGPHARHHLDDDDDEDDSAGAAPIGSGAPMLIYSNYNFLDVKLELQVRLIDGTLTEKVMHTAVSPPGLRFPSGGVIDNHFVVSGTFLTSTKQEYALWALDLRTLTWSRIDAGGSIFSQGSWNRGVLWNRRNAFVIMGNRKRSLVDDYNNRRINFSNICIVELEAFGLYDNPKLTEPTSNYTSVSIPAARTDSDMALPGRPFGTAAEDLGSLALNNRELADMDFLAIDGTRIPVNSRLIARRWGPQFVNLLRESMMAASETDTATLRPSVTSNPSRNSSITITPSLNSNATTLTNNGSLPDVPDVRTAPPQTRSRLFYLPHTAPTLRALLYYLYTSSLPSPPNSLATPQIFCSLLQFARPYKINGLLEAVVERLHESLDGRNAAAIFNAAAMGAGGGESLSFATSDGRSIRESEIPIRTASLIGFDGLTNGSSRPGPGLRIDTDMANGRSARNTLRPGQLATALNTDASDDDVPGSATTDTSVSDAEPDSFSGAFSTRHRQPWNGALSSVVGLQKRGLRGLMEGRRMRERGQSDRMDNGKVGLGIA